MATGDWDFQAGRLNGDGTIDIVETELPIAISSMARNLSAPQVVAGTISFAVERLKNAGRPVFEPGNTVVVAVANDLPRFMAIYQKPRLNGDDWLIDGIGLGGYPQGMPFDGDATYVAVDPLNIFRDIWDHLQSQPNGNLGVTIDDTTSPVRVGSANEEVEFTTGTGENVSFDSGPRRLNWWSTHDLGQEISRYAAETPFDWAEEISWQGDYPHCHIRLGYPRIGGRKSYGLILGQNLDSVPSVAGQPFVNGVWALGAGEGRDRIRGFAGVTDGRVRRIRVIEDKSLDSKMRADSRAQDALGLSRGEYFVEELEVFDHPNAPLAGIELGDEVPLVVETSWIDLHTTVRVIGRSEDPARSDVARITVAGELVV